ncbi:MAG: sigma-70 family RNA polymerase sigma factor [Chitinophagaceae bacterium]|nr:sigma-70 family RNA polymerase sigma factor [Chitinophagaceae bacterium]MBK7679152.1 sigma-70 family RNA polymerase sigma factor [Chitinophagaceae bacterium]MBK9659325.1 sigma-70 family RNA polymerase sigma factor [Chitinophagaceae bacterium]MBK9937149.1 sigma-70 family RNA polymerase sigma factor [Chitinophagaceae bacterium]MBP6233634.1 sigma-70 family RNA polymerase sigma factor [Chitinophagaceae bacterium]
MKPQTDEKALLEGLANNDKKAVETIYKDNFNMVQSLIINNNGSSDDAKDIFQETIIVLYEKVRSGTFELHCQIKTFVYSVSRRLWLKRLQQQNRYSSPGDSMENVVAVDEDIEAHEQRNTEFEMMEKAISNLGEPCKSLLEAYYLQKQNMQVIAANFGYTNADNAKNQKYKCLMRLKKIFFAHYKNGNSDE